MSNNGKSYWFNEIFDETRRIVDISYEMQSLAKAFARTGNIGAYEELSQKASELLASQKVITQSVGAHCNEEFKKSQEQTTLVVKAALAGITLVEHKEG